MSLLERLQKTSDGRRSPPTNFISVDLRERDKVILHPISDLHLGSPQFNRALFESNLEWIMKNEDSIVVLNGDLVEAATRDSVGAGIYEQVLPIGEQVEQTLDYFLPLAKQGRIIGSTNGNHEDRVHKSTGFDISRLIAQQLEVPYFRNGAHFRWRVGTQNYTGYLTHGSSGSRLPWTKIRQPLDLGRFIQADIIGIGHVHDMQVLSQEYQQVNFRNNTVEKKERFFLLTGHYLNWENGYAQAKSMMPSKQGTPKIKFRGDEYQIRVSI